MNKIKNFLLKIKSSKEKKILIENFFSLSVLQIADYIFPLITLPYLVRVLGPEKYGLVSFAQSFIQYFVILTDYGFNLSATRTISINRNDKQKVSEIFSAVMTIKIIFAFLSLLLLTIIIFIFPNFRTEYLLYYLCFGTVIGYILFPIWFFQGMEDMKYILIRNITAKTIFTITIFIFIKSPSDYNLLALFNSLGYIVAGIIGLKILFPRYLIKFSLPSQLILKNHLIDGWHIFVSTILMNIYGSSNIFILGLLTNNKIVGYFSAAYKIINAITGCMRPLQQSIYPFLSKKTAISMEQGKALLKKFIFFIFSLSLIIMGGIIITSPLIIHLLCGETYYPSIIILQIISFLCFSFSINNAIAIQGFLNFNLSFLVSKVALRAVILNFILTPLLIYFFNGIGLAVGIVIVELFVVANNFYYLNKLLLNSRVNKSE